MLYTIITTRFSSTGLLVENLWEAECKAKGKQLVSLDKGLTNLPSNVFVPSLEISSIRSNIVV